MLDSVATHITSEVNLIKLFWHKFTHIFCKLDRFINANNKWLSAVKRSGLQTKVSKFTPKNFCEIDSSWGQSYKTFQGRIL
jgi:hypothetical protein